MSTRELVSNTGVEAVSRVVPGWDVCIRLFHWSLALSVGFMLLSGLTGFRFFDWHRTVGEFVLALLAFRLVWGVIGPTNARLLPLLRGPRAVAGHVRQLIARELPAEPGHNAAGGWAVLLMLVLVGLQAVSGTLIADEDELVEGRFYGALDGAATDTLYRLHKMNAELLQVVVVVHIAVIALYALWGRRNLLPAMINARPVFAARRVVLAGAGAAIAIGLLWYVVFG